MELRTAMQQILDDLKDFRQELNRAANRTIIILGSLVVASTISNLLLHNLHMLH